MIRRWFARLDPALRVAVICFAVVALLIVLALVALPADAADGPAVVTIRGPVQHVSCGLGCCCGLVQGTYQGRTYGGAYCRWFRPLREGETVTKTGRPDANGYIR
jgi:hypothetical protein